MHKTIQIALRTFFAFSVAFLVEFPAQAQYTKEVSATVKEATVFLQNAQLFSTLNTTVNSGVTELAVVNVPVGIDATSIQAELHGKAVLLGIRYEYNYLQPNEKPQNVKQVEDSLENYVNRIRTLTDQIDVYRKEENMVLANQSIGGQKGVQVDDLEEVADFFRKRLFTIRANILKNETQLKALNKVAEKLGNQLSELNWQQKPKGRILVSVSTDNATALGLNISYVVNNVGWAPVYDLRATNTKSPMKLFYKANVYQNTGFNWNNVKLTLATTNPGIGATKPQLTPWYLNFYEPETLADKKKSRFSLRKAAKVPAPAAIQNSPELEGASDASWGADEVAVTTAEFTQVTESSLAVNFNVSIPYSIPSDGKPHLVDIQTYDVPATYIYSAAPKLSSDAFLMAQLTGWEDYNILPGEANIFMEGTFTGKTNLNPQATGDTMLVSLGRDKRVVISREKVKELTSKSFFGNNRKETKGFVISVRNTKNEAVDLTLEDQIPVSNNHDIEVEMEDNGGGTLDKTTGKITWAIKLKPNETKKIPLKFSVKFPKNRQLMGL